MSSKFLDKTGLDTLWAKIKSTFQTLGNLVTAWGSTPSDSKYPSEKLVKTSLDTIPFNADFQFMTQAGTSDKCCIAKFSKPVNAYNGSNGTTVGLYVLEAYNYRASVGPEYQSKVQLMIKITDGTSTNSSVVAIDGLSGKYLPISGFSLHVKTAVNNVVDIYLVYTTSANYVTCVGKFIRLWDVNYFTETWYKSSTSFTPFDASGDNVSKSVITDNILTKLTGFVGGTLAFSDGKPVIDTSVLGTLDVEHGGTGNTSVDTAPTANSTKMVTSGGIFNALNDKVTKIEFTQPADYKSFVIIEDVTRWYDPAGTAAISKGYQLIGQIAYWRSGGGFESMAVAFIKFHLNYRWQLTNDSCCEVKSTLPNNSFCPMIIRDARDENNVKYYFGLRTKIAWNSTVQFIGRTSDLSFSNLEWIPGENAAHTGNGTEFPVGITIERNCDLLEWNSIANGGTGATTAIGAEYNILNQVADIDTTIDGNRKIALCNQTKSASNGVFRWLKLSNVWTWIKGLLLSESGVNISGNAATATTATTAAGYTSGGAIDTALQGKVDKETGKGLSTNDYTTADKNKVASAVQPGDLGTAAYKDVPASGNARTTQVVMGSDSRLSDARPASDVSAWAKAATKPTYTASEVGAVPTSRTVNGKALSSNITLNASDVGSLDGLKVWSGGANSVYGYKVCETADIAHGTSTIYAIAMGTMALTNKYATDPQASTTSARDGSLAFGSFYIWCYGTPEGTLTCKARLFSSNPAFNNTDLALCYRKDGDKIEWFVGFGPLDDPVTASSALTVSRPFGMSVSFDYTQNIVVPDSLDPVPSGKHYDDWYGLFKQPYMLNNANGVGSISQPVYVMPNGQIKACNKPVQVVNSIDTSSMTADVLYVM